TAQASLADASDDGAAAATSAPASDGAAEGAEDESAERDSPEGESSESTAGASSAGDGGAEPPSDAGTSDAGSPDDAGTGDSQATTDGDSTGMQLFAAELPEPPYLRWSANDEAGELVASVTFTVQGPKDDSIAEKDDSIAEPEGEGEGDTEAAWHASLLASVLDNVGEPDYVGLDLDPAPGVFLVKQLI